MYSPADRPSRLRAAPAKNRSWSTIGGISSLAVSASGLPVFSLSRAMSSSAFASIASAIFSSASERSDGVLSRQDSKAVGRRREGAVDVLGRAVGGLGEDLAGGRVDEVHHLAVGGVDGLTVDEVADDAVAHVLSSWLRTGSLGAGLIASHPSPRRRETTELAPI